MSFANTQYILYAIVGIIVIGLILNRLNARYFKWVKSYWFYERSWMNRFSSFFYALSLFLFMLALLDLRGPEKKVRANLPDQRTIILIDASSSMLAEDVRPNRFVKSLQIARHFAKNAPGHQLSIVLFSDIQKRLIPFTDDVDLIDSRLAALEKTNSVAGGSNISQAIAESVGYFESDAKDEENTGGNILVFTDAEESEGAFNSSVPSNINLAVVGVGTLKGANIPLRHEDGDFRGYKTYKGEPVVTRLDENYLRKMGKNTKSFKYWIANSYSLPTDEIMNFFRSAYKKKQNTGDVRIRPVYSHLILIPAILFYCLSVLIGRFKVFKTAKSLIVIVMLGMASRGVQAQEGDVLSAPDVKKDLEVIKEGKADRKFTLKVAEKLLRTKDSKKARELYEEYSKADDEDEVRFNYATSLLKSNQFKEAKGIYKELLKNSKNEDLKKKIRGNLSLHLKKKEQQKQNPEQQQNEENKDQQNQDKNNSQSGSDKSKDNQNQNQNQNQNKNQNQDKKEEEENKQHSALNRAGNDENKTRNQKDSEKQNQNQKGNEGKDQKQQDQKQGQQDQKQSSQQGGQQQKPDNGKMGEEKESKENKGKGGKEKEKSGEDGEKEEEQKPQGPQTLEDKEKEIQQKRRMVKTPAMIKQILSDDRDLQKRMMDTSTNLRGEQRPKRDW